VGLHLKLGGAQRAGAISKQSLKKVFGIGTNLGKKHFKNMLKYYKNMKKY